MGDDTAGPPLDERPRRLQLLANAYPLSATDRAELLSEVVRMQVQQIARVTEAGHHGDFTMQRHWKSWPLHSSHYPILAVARPA